MAQFKIQLRGHCPLCGREQAVKNGKMSQHGYQVKGDNTYAYYHGICPGQHYAPIEHDRKPTDELVRTVRQDAQRASLQAQKLEDGSVHPAKAKSGRRINDPDRPGRRIDEMIPYDQAQPYHQQQAREAAVWNLRSEARQMLNFAEGLEKIVNLYHGKPLVEVNKDQGPAPILDGERKYNSRGMVLTASYTERGMVHYTYTRENQPGKFRAKMATRSWRLLEPAA